MYRKLRVIVVKKDKIMQKFFRLPLRKPGSPVKPAPDEWPPDGSMHFSPFDHPIGLTGLPPNAVQYEFAANVGEDDPIVFSLGQEIISLFCDSHKTLIIFSFDPELPKYKCKKTFVPPAEIVVQFLRSLVPEAPITQKGNKIVRLGIGYPKDLFSKYQAASTMPYCSIDTYLFSKGTVPLHPEEGLSMVENGIYQADLYLDYGPNALDIVFDPKALDITEVKKIIANVCYSHNIPLISPSDLPEIK